MCSTTTSSSCIQMKNVTLSCICDFVFFVLLRYDRFIYYDMHAKNMYVDNEMQSVLFLSSLYQYITSYVYIYLLRGPHTDEDSKPSSFLVLTI